MLSAGIIQAFADSGTLGIANVQNAIPGMTGSFDIVLTGSGTTYRDFQFDITLPEGLTCTGYSAGELLNGHAIETSDQGSNTTRFTGYNDNGNTLKAATGTLLTLNFTVDGSTSTGDKTAALAQMVCSDDNAAHHTLTAGNKTITIINTLTLKEDDTTAPATVSNVNVTLERSFSANQWYTICLPFALTATQVTDAFGTNVKVGDFNGYDISGSSIGVGFTTVTEMAANHPYIIKVTDGTVESPTFTGVDIVSGTTVNNKGEDDTDANIKAMIGVYTETTLDANRLYLKDSKFKYSDGTSKVKPYRAYFHFCDFTDAMHSRVILIDEGGTTGIRILDDPQADADGWYDLGGRKLPGKPASKGVYIQNGKKVVIK